MELEAALSDNGRLQEENKLLRAQIDVHKKAPQLSHLPLSPTASNRDIDALDAIFEYYPPETGPGADETTDVFLDLVRKISAHYRRIKGERECYKTAYKQIAIKFRQQMHVWKRWQAYYSSLEGRSYRVKPVNPDVPKRGEASTEDDRAANAPMSSGLHLEPINSAAAPVFIEQCSKSVSSEQDRPVSTQDTEEEMEPEQGATHNETTFVPAEDDIPIIISERSLKRKRANSTENTKSGQDRSTVDGSAHRPVSIKEESSKMDQLPQSTRHLRRTETLDFESLGSRIVTPKRHQRFQQLLKQTQRESFRQRALEELRQDRSKSLPFDAFTESCQFFNQREPMEIDLTADHCDESEHRNKDREMRATQVSTAPAQAGGRLPRSSRHVNDIVNAPNSNSAVAPRTRTASLLAKGSSRFFERSADAIPLVTEDGEDAPATRRRRKRHRKTAVRAPGMVQRSSSDNTGEKHGRLQSLLDSTSPARAPLSERNVLHGDKQFQMPNEVASTPATDANCMNLDQEHSEGKPQDNTVTAIGYPRSAIQRQGKEEGMKSSLLKAKSPQSNVEPQTAQLVQQQTPLRFLPSSELKLSDFKPNAKVNDDLDFAYKETVRNRDARRCLPGCTDPNCCGGTFRRLAELGDLPNLEAPRGLWDDSLNVDEDPDTRLLVSYLGISADDVSNLSAEGRQKELAAAYAELFANQFGKHRQQWERARSPPGFWNADFPSTQTQMRDRMEAVRREREKVEERAREARREGGKWLFRDEAGNES